MEQLWTLEKALDLLEASGTKTENDDVATLLKKND
jgi:hypothetical protein